MGSRTSDVIFAALLICALELVHRVVWFLGILVLFVLFEIGIVCIGQLWRLILNVVETYVNGGKYESK